MQNKSLTAEIFDAVAVGIADALISIVGGAMLGIFAAWIAG